MTGGVETSVWRFAGRSVRGASHRRRKLPNQDAIAWCAIADPATADGGVAAAVADGHGSSACFRSDAGAEIAVRSALAVLEDFCADRGKDPVALPAELVSRWRAGVQAHIDTHPLGMPDGPAAWRVYGTTLLAVLATPDSLLYLQIGDGDILAVSNSGDITRLFARDQRLLGVETTSLCTAGAAGEMRVRLEPLDGSPPALLLLATDGYANSFRDDAGFLRVGADLLDMIRTDGIEKVEDSLDAWLTEASELGSGDDITLALLCRTACEEAANAD